MPETTDEARNEESWAQTLITVTPEDQATIRTISGKTLISARDDSPLTLSIEEITDRRRVHFNAVRRDLDGLEKRIEYNDAESQTFLQGVPRVTLSLSFEDQASQTIYLQGAPRLLQDIASIMNERPMPFAEKITAATQSALTFDSTTPKDRIVDGLKDRILVEESPDDRETPSTTVSASTLVRDGLHFVLERVFWLTDPGLCVPEVELREQEAQTCIKFDVSQGKVVLDADVQTVLTCEPKRSNAGLLSDWNAATEFVHQLLGECLEAVVLPRIIAECLVDEVVARCATQIRPPSKDETAQTVAVCNAIEDGDEEVLRKLRLSVVIDAFESSIVVLPIVEILIENTRSAIRRDAQLFAEDTVARICNNSVSMAVKIAALRREASQPDKSMDQIFEARKRRLRESLGQRKLGANVSSGTQTHLAGVPDIVKVKEPRETICSVCMKHSECFACAKSLDNDSESLVEPDPVERGIRGKILGTRDILMAYNPCYVVATPSEIVTDSMRPAARLRPAPPRPPSSKLLPLLASSSASDKLHDVAGIQRVQQKSTRRRTGNAGMSSSLDDWAKVAQEASSSFGAWSSRGSRSEAGERIGSSSTYLDSKDLSTEDHRLPIRSVEALRVLKNTFNRCDRGFCSDCGTRDEEENGSLEASSIGRISEERKSRAKARTNGEMAKSSRKLKPDYDGEGVRVIPIFNLDAFRDES